MIGRIPHSSVLLFAPDWLVTIEGLHLPFVSLALIKIYFYLIMYVGI